MTPEQASVFIRVIPPEFRDPRFTVSRNNVYEWVQGAKGAPARRLVGQLTEGQRLQLPADQAGRLLGGVGQTALATLSAVGSVASIATLGVCVVGFLHVSRSLKRVEQRLERVEQKLDAVADLVGVIDQKVDQLLVLGTNQLDALTELHRLLMSFQTAAVHRALETLELRSRLGESPHRDHELLSAAQTLHEYRIWLAETREGDPTRPLFARTELLRAEVLVALAEARARLLIDDAAFAALEVEKVLEHARREVSLARSMATADGGVPSLLSCIVGDLDMHREAAEVWSWLDRRSSGHASRELLREVARGYNDLAQRLTSLDGATSAGDTDALRRFREQGLLRPKRVDDTDAASLVAGYRLARSLEPALTLCTAFEVVGPPLRPLLTLSGSPNAPALVVELESMAA